MAVVVGDVEYRGTLLQAELPTLPELNLEKPDAMWTDFVLMRNSGRTEMNGERTELPFLAAVAFTVKAVQQDGEKGQFVRVGREPAWRSVAQIRKDRTAQFASILDGSVKRTRPQSLLADCVCHSLPRGCFCSRRLLPVFVSVMASMWVCSRRS